MTYRTTAGVEKYANFRGGAKLLVAVWKKQFAVPSKRARRKRSPLLPLSSLLVS